MSPKVWLWVLIVGGCNIGCAVVADAVAVMAGYEENVLFWHIIVIGTLLALIAENVVGLAAAVLRMIAALLRM